MRAVWTLAAGLAAALAVTGLALAQAAPAGLVRPEGLTRLSPHVQVIPDNSAWLVANIGFVVGSRAILVVDTGLGPTNGAAVAETARTIAPGRTIYLVATHAHPEHDLGAQAFPAGSVMIRSRAQQADSAADMALAKLFEARAPAFAELLKGAAFRPADEVFDTVRDLDLGGVTVRLQAWGPAHTGGDTTVWVAADRVLFSGDLAMKAQPSIASPKATLEAWRRALDGLDRLRPAMVVPSHGPLGDAGYIAGYRDYLSEVARRTAEARAAGQDVGAATETVTAAMVDRYPDRARLAGAVKMAYGAP